MISIRVGGSPVKLDNIIDNLLLDESESTNRYKLTDKWRDIEVIWICEKDVKCRGGSGEGDILDGD